MGRGLKFIGKRQVEFIKYSSMLKGGKTINFLKVLTVGNQSRKEQKNSRQ